MKKILVVMTNQTTYGDTIDTTGLWLGEATEFVNAMTEKGYVIDYVSPKGGYVPLDPRSMKYVTAPDMVLYQDTVFQKNALSESLSPEEVQAKDYEAIYFTGGHGVMWDFTNNESLAQITSTIYQQGGFVTSVCHGIAGLLNVKDTEGNYLIQGKKVTGFTTMEETLSGKKSVVPFLNEVVAKEHGAIFMKEHPFKSYVVTDGHLITGQNPQSPKAVAEALLKALSA